MDFALLEENYVLRAYEDLKSRSFRDYCSPKAMQDGTSSKKQRLQCVVNLLKTMPSSLVLDIGCGESMCTRADCFTVGIDVCKPAERHWASGNADFVQADLMHLPFRKGVFDVLLLVSVLHHVPLEQRRLQCLRNCFSLANPVSSQLLVVAWAKEQQTAQFPGNDVLVPYNLEDLCRQGHVADIPFNKYSTREQRIIKNALPVSVINPLLRRACCQQYLPKRVQRQLLEVAARLASFYPMLTSLDFYEARFQDALKFMFDRISELKQLQQQPANSDANGNETLLLNVVRQFALQLSRDILAEAFTKLSTIHREVLKYRYYHVFHGGELEALISQLKTTYPQYGGLETLNYDYEHGNWCIQLRIGS